MIFAALSPCVALAENCGRWKHEIERLDNAKRAGGNSSQIKYLQKQRNYYEEQLSRCEKDAGTGSPKITVYAGGASNKSVHEDLFESDINNDQLQQLIKTCNFWINETNRNPSSENHSFKENACGDAKNMESEIISPKEKTNFIQTRTVKECIKPNNVIDKDVKLCVQGLKEPSWIVVKNNSKQ